MGSYRSSTIIGYSNSISSGLGRQVEAKLWRVSVMTNDITSWPARSQQTPFGHPSRWICVGMWRSNRAHGQPAYDLLCSGSTVSFPWKKVFSEVLSMHHASGKIYLFSTTVDITQPVGSTQDMLSKRALNWKFRVLSRASNSETKPSGTLWW